MIHLGVRLDFYRIGDVIAVHLEFWKPLDGLQRSEDTQHSQRFDSFNVSSFVIPVKVDKRVRMAPDGRKKKPFITLFGFVYAVSLDDFCPFKSFHVSRKYDFRIFFLPHDIAVGQSHRDTIHR